MVMICRSIRMVGSILDLDKKYMGIYVENNLHGCDPDYIHETSMNYLELKLFYLFVDSLTCRRSCK